MTEDEKEERNRVSSIIAWWAFYLATLSYGVGLVAVYLTVHSHY